MQGPGEHVAERWLSLAPRVAQLFGEGLHERRAADVFVAPLCDGFSEMRLGPIRSLFREARSNALSPELDQRLGGVQAAHAHQLLEQRLDRLWVALRCPGQAGDHRGRHPVILLEHD